MSITTMELYDALISAGVDEDKARNAAKAVISRDEAKHLATRSDIDKLRAELFKYMAAQTLVIIGGVVTLLQLLQ